MRKLMWVAALGLVAASWAVAPGLAASLSGASGTLGGGNAAVTKCDADGVRSVFTPVGGNVTAITVSGVASACGGLTLNVVVNNGSTTTTGTGLVPIGGGSVVVLPIPPIAMTNAMQTDFLIA